MDETATEKFWDMVNDFDTCMVVTRAGGSLRGRPMAPYVSDERREIMFLTERDTHKVDEIEADPHVALSVSGRARVSQDRALVKRLWGPEAEAWLPQGPDDPTVAVLVVDPDGAELWDVTGNKVAQAWEFAKAYLGNKDRPDTTEYRKVKL